MGWSVQYEDSGWNTIAGAILTDLQDELNFQIDGAFKIPNDTANQALMPVDIASEKDIRIRWDSTVVWTGIWTGGDMKGDWIECTSYDKVMLTMERKDITAEYFEISAATILTAICAAAGVTANFDASGFPGSTAPIISVRFSYTKCSDAAKYLAEACDGDWWTSSGTTFNIDQERTATTRAVTVLGVSRSGFDSGKVYDKIRVVAVNDEGLEVVGTYGAGTNVHTFRTQKAYDASTLTNIAKRKYDSINEPSSGSSIEIILTDGYDLYPGDYITVTNAYYKLSGNNRIWKISKKNNKILADLIKAEFSIERAIMQTQELEDLGIYVPVPPIDKANQEWNSNLTFSPTDNNTAAWTSGTVWFQDSDTLSINSSNTGNLGVGVHWVYFVWESSTLLVSATESDTVGDGKGVLAKLTVSATATQNIGIETYGAAGNAVIKDFIQEDAVYAEAMRPGIQSYTHDIEFTTYGAGDTHAQVEWTTGTVDFADGSTQSITPASNSAVIGDGLTRYIYFTAGSTNLTVTSTYSDAVSDTTGLLCIVYVSTDTVQEISIQVFKGKGGNIIADFIAAKAIETEHITTKSMYGKDIATAQYVGTSGGVGGVRTLGALADVITTPTAIGDTIAGNFTEGIWGFDTGPKRTFHLAASDGVLSIWGTGGVQFLTYPGVPAGEPGNVKVGGIDATQWTDIFPASGAQNVILLKANLGTQIAALEADGTWAGIDGTTNQFIFDDSLVAIIPQGTVQASNPSLGTSVRKFSHIWGTVHYTDLHMNDLVCPKCGQEFEEHDELTLAVNGFYSPEDNPDYKEITCVPIHINCPNKLMRIWKRIRAILSIYI